MSEDDEIGTSDTCGFVGRSGSGSGGSPQFPRHALNRSTTAIFDDFTVSANCCTHFQLSSSRSPANGSVISVMSVIWPRPTASSAAYIASSSAASSGSMAWAVS